MNEYKGQEYKSFVGEKGLSIVLYYATWCGPCKMLKPVLEKIDKELEKEKIILPKKKPLNWESPK